jgi:truncated hemoglobin YjbI/quinol monooxygenase YgiN
VTIEYVRYRIPEADGTAFETAYARAAAELAAAPQCLDYELSRCTEDPGAYVLRITWTSERDHVEGFRGSEAFGRFLAEIGEYRPAIEEMRHYEPTTVVGRGAALPTLYEWAGGAEALEKLFDAFYDKVLDDELLEPVFRGMDPGHPRHVAVWLGEVLGGPARYTAELGGHTHMIGRHLGRGITETQRRRWFDLLLNAADEVGLPSDPEFRAAFVGYLEWGTRMAVLYSAPGMKGETTDPVPVWGWARGPFLG